VPALPGDPDGLYGTHLYFDDLEIGPEWESPGRTVTEADVVFRGTAATLIVHVTGTLPPGPIFSQTIAPRHARVLGWRSGLGLGYPSRADPGFLSVRDGNSSARFSPATRSACAQDPGKDPARPRQTRRNRLGAQIINHEGKVVQEGVLVTLVEARGRKLSPQAEPPPPQLSLPRRRS